MKETRWVVLALVTLAILLDMFVYDMVVPFLPGHLAAAGVSQTRTGILFGAYPLALLLVLPFVAPLGRWLGMRSLLLLGTFGLAGSCLLSAGSDHFVSLLIARSLQGIAGGVTWTAGLAVLACVYPASQRGWAMGTAIGAAAIGPLLGPPLGGILHDLGGCSLPFACAGVLALLLGLGLALLLPRVDQGSAEPTEPRRRSWSVYLVPASVVVIGSTFLSFLEPTLSLHLARRIHIGPTAVGLMFGLAALAYGMTSPIAGWLSDRFGRRSMMALGLVAAVVMLPLIGVPRTFETEAAVLAAFGVACSFLLGPTLPEFADVTADANHGTAYAVFNTAYAVGMAVGPVAGGYITAAWGFRTALVVFALAALVFLPIVLPALAFISAGFSLTIHNVTATLDS